MSKSVINIDPNIIADYILKFAYDRGQEITNLRLQKLVYYVEAWYMANYDDALFEEDYEAWIHGPVLRSLYNKFRKFKSEPIVIKSSVVYPALPKKLQEILEEVMGVYGELKMWQLERLVHSEKPWKDARRGISDLEPSVVIIGKDSIRSYYRSLIDAKAKKIKS